MLLIQVIQQSQDLNMTVWLSHSHNRPPKRKKLVVANKATVKSWGFDWMEADIVAGRDGGKGALQINRVACRQYVPKTSRNNRGSVSNNGRRSRSSILQPLPYEAKRPSQLKQSFSPGVG